MQHAPNIQKGFLRLICVLALVMVGFAHKPVLANLADARMPAYELPDGSFASICFADHDSEPEASKDFGCDACRLSSAILVAAPPCINGLALAYPEEMHVFERRQRLARALYPPGSGPRAPPAGLMFA